MKQKIGYVTCIRCTPKHLRNSRIFFVSSRIQNSCNTNPCRPGKGFSVTESEKMIGLTASTHCENIYVQLSKRWQTSHARQLLHAQERLI